MGRLCERPGCSQPAEVMYGIDADHLTVWIEPFDGTPATSYRAGVLCRRHADAMVVPLGWMLDDRREPVPRLFKPRAPEAPPPVRPRRPRGRRHADETGQLDLDAASVAAADPESGPEPDDHESAWKPVFDEADDLGGLLTASSPLLSRAFGKRERPRRG